MVFVVLFFMCVFLNFELMAQNSSLKEKQSKLELLFDNYYRNTNNKKKQKNFALKYIALAKQIKQEEYLITGYTLLANSSDFTQGIQYIDSIKNISTHNSVQLQLLQLTNIGSFYYTNRYFKESLNNYLKAYKILKGSKTKDLDFLISIKNVIAKIKNIQDRTTEALTIYLENEKLLKTKIGTKEQNLYEECLFSITECYNKLGDVKENDKYIALGLELTKENQGYNTYPYFLFAKGKNDFNKRAYESSLVYLKSSLSKFKQNDDFINYAEAHYYIGLLFEKKNNKDLAIANFQKVDSIFNERKYIYLDLKNVYHKLIAFYEKKGDIKRSYYYSKQLVKADSLLQKNYEYIVNKTHTEFDMPEMMEGKDQVLSKVKSSFLGYIVFTILIVLFLIISFIVYKKKKDSLFKKQSLNFEELRDKLEENQSNVKFVELIETDSKAIDKNEESLDDDNEIQNKTTIDDSTIKNILHRLEVFENENRFINPECTLDQLAIDLKTNTTYLSKVINEHKKSNFSNYIHDLRINYLIKLLKTDKRYLNYSIHALASEIGYKNHSTFTRVFNSKTGMSPSFFVNSLKNESSLDNL